MKNEYILKCVARESKLFLNNINTYNKTLKKIISTSSFLGLAGASSMWQAITKKVNAIYLQEHQRLIDFNFSFLKVVITMQYLSGLGVKNYCHLIPCQQLGIKVIWQKSEYLTNEMTNLGRNIMSINLKFLRVFNG